VRRSIDIELAPEKAQYNTTEDLERLLPLFLRVARLRRVCEEVKSW
jgi:hypothetical protein